MNERRFLERLPLAVDRPVLAYGATLLLVLIATIARFAADPILPPGFPYVSFFPAVMLSAFLFGRAMGILSAVTSGFLAWYFFINPPETLDLSGATVMALVFYALVVGVDIAVIHLMQIASRRLASERRRSQELAAHRETLFSELQHRVSNNLAVVSALLTLQQKTIEDERARRALADAAGRLTTIAKLQRALHDPRGGEVAFDTFLRELARDTLVTAGGEHCALSVKAPGSLRLSADRAIPLALIVSELIANAVEHGAGPKGCNIRVTVKDGEPLEVLVEDDGRGLPPGFDASLSTSLGLRTVRAMAGQIGGRFSLSRRLDGGTTARLDLPAVHPVD